MIENKTKLYQTMPVTILHNKHFKRDVKYLTAFDNIDNNVIIFFNFFKLLEKGWRVKDRS